MKMFTTLIAIGGLLFGTAMIGYFGFGEVAHALFAVRWTGFVTIVAYHLAGIALLGVCWYLLTPQPAPVMAFIWGRLVRDSGAEVLPFSQVGGFVMGARAAASLGVPGAVAIGSTIVDVTLEAFGQLGYTALGLSILSAQKLNNHLIAWTAFGVVIALLAGTIFVLVQRHSLATAERIVRRVPHRWLKDIAVRLAPIHHVIDDIYRSRSTLCSAGFLHLSIWIASSVEGWIALRFMGAGLSIGSVIAIESLLYAIRSVAFAIPNAVGVQEGAYVMLGALFGLRPEVALALSLLKRARDLIIGVPTLLTWQILESRRLLSRIAVGDGWKASFL
jgi:putative membrane protein